MGVQPGRPNVLMQLSEKHNSHHLNQFLSVFSLANITGGAGHLDALALQQSHSLVHVGLPSAAHHHVGSSLTQSLGRGEADSEEKKSSSVRD